MIKYVAVTLASLYGVLLVFGEESRREVVTRDTTGPVFNLSLASIVPQVETSSIDAVRSDNLIDESEAVAHAIEAGRKIRNGLKQHEPLMGLVTAVEQASDAAVIEASVAVVAMEGADASAAAEDVQPMWYVSGSRVNLRAGPGTGNAVVAQLGFGTEAEVLSDTSSDWIQIRTADGTGGWIYSTFLTDQPPT